MNVKTVIVVMTNRWEILRLADIATPFEPFHAASTIILNQTIPVNCFSRS
jgi:hypothetical protein